MKKKTAIKLLFAILSVAMLFAIAVFSASAADTAFTGEKYDYDDWYYVTKTFYIEKSSSSFDFSGKELKPVIKVYSLESGVKTYLPSNQYTIEFEDECVYPGQKYFNVYSTSLCEYEFEVYDSFDITFDKTAITVTSIPSCTFNGNYQEPKPTVKYKSVTFKEIDDFTCYYDDNRDAGTATVLVSFNWRFDDIEIEKTFNINKAPASSVSVGSISTCTYDGYEQTPYLTVEFNGNTLWEGDDYTVKYSNNKLPGTAKATIKLKGNFTGTIEKSFKIKVGSVTDINKTPSDKGVSFYFGYTTCDYYQLYRYNSSTNKYESVGKTKYGSIEDTGLKQFSTYKYKVRAVVKIDSKKYYGPYKSFSVKTLLSAPTVKLTIKSKKISVSWSKNKKADGYILYKVNMESGKKKKLGTFDAKTFKYTDTSVKDYVEHIYYVVATRKENGKTYKSYSEYYYTGSSTLDPENIVRGYKLKPKTSFKTYNTQGTKTILYGTVTISQNDINTLKAFAKKHFTSKMSSLEKVRITHNWIHKNVTYAVSGELWNKIVGKTYVDAIFNHKLGQCAQYNGALAAMMTYIGYDVQLIMGHRVGYYSGSKMQHFWTECKINGLTYVMETGNYKRNGSWSYFFVPYKYTSGYTKNTKLISGR